jgi:uncharacterized membrane protein
MRLFGHPIHPMLVHFPIVLWTVATGAYVASAAGLAGPAAAIAKFANSAGLTMAILAMIAGLLELRCIDSRTEAMRVATWHMIMMATVWICFLVALMMSISPELDRSTAQLVAVACAVAGFLLMGVGGWLGGRLVYEFGIAVKDQTKS